MPHTPASRHTSGHTSGHTTTGSSSSLSRREARRHRKSRSQGKPQGKTQRQSQRQQPLLSKDQRKVHQRKVLWAGGAITLLAMATILPTQVSSQAIADNKCEQVIKSGAEVSRSQLSSLRSIPEGSTKQSLQQVLAEPYCSLPALSLSESPQAVAPQKNIAGENIAGEDSPQDSLVQYVLERDAYPLAFDPEAWLVVTYHSGEYQGYDFVFKP